MFNPEPARRLMADLGLSFEKLAKKAGIPSSSARKALGPSGNPTAKTLSRLAMALQSDERVFFAGQQHYSDGAVACSTEGGIT